MPELPEAETVARALDRAVKKRKITKVEIFAPKLRTPLSPLCSARLEGCTFTGCRRRARYAVADLDDGRTLVFHFGMSGTVRVEAKDAARRKHDHAELTLDDGRVIRFNDPRRFGSLEVQPCGSDGWPESLVGIGVEPLSDAFTGEVIFKASRGRKLSVKELLMDNAIVTGIGNIYAAETLFACAIEWGGTTVHDFKSVDGTEGKFVQKLKIYGRTACPICGTKVAKVVLGGRTSWYCPKCQR